MEQGTCGEYCVRGTLWSRVHVLGVGYSVGLYEAICSMTREVHYII